MIANDRERVDSVGDERDSDEQQQSTGATRGSR